MQLRRTAIALLTALALVLTLTAGSVSAGGFRGDHHRSWHGFGHHHHHVFLLRLTGNQEATATCAPPTVCGDPDAVAKMVLVVLPRRDVICFATRWRNIDGTVVAAHIHPAPVGVAGPVAVPLFSGTFNGTDHTAGCVSANGLAKAIVANPAAYYVNIHSTVFQPGAVRAQLSH